MTPHDHVVGARPAGRVILLQLDVSMSPFLVNEIPHFPQDPGMSGVSDFCIYLSDFYIIVLCYVISSGTILNVRLLE